MIPWPMAPITLCVGGRARERLQLAREEAKRPGAEKAARTQELHKALRVSVNHTLS